MAEMKDKLVSLEDLKAVHDELDEKIVDFPRNIKTIAYPTGSSKYDYFKTLEQSMGPGPVIVRDNNQYIYTDLGKLTPVNYQDDGLAGLVKPDEKTITCTDDVVGDFRLPNGTITVKPGGISMEHLAQDVKDAIGSGGSGGGETDIAVIRRVVNEQLAKMKFTVNEDGHLIIETPEE